MKACGIVRVLLRNAILIIISILVVVIVTILRAMFAIIKKVSDYLPQLSESETLPFSPILLQQIHSVCDWITANCHEIFVYTDLWERGQLSFDKDLVEVNKLDEQLATFEVMPISVGH